MIKLVLLRHGESKWNFENRFTGWTDVDLTKRGALEAKTSGKLLKENGFYFDLAYTSILKRANSTLNICLKELGLLKTPIKYDWRLNERHYGALQGLNKQETAREYGDDQILIWRRSYDIPPPPLEFNDKRHPRFSKKYKNIDPKKLPIAESLKDTEQRFLPLWEESILPNLKIKKKILIVAHGNSLRALIKHLDKVLDKDIINLNIPTGIPLVYEINHKLNSVNNYYLGGKNEIAKKTDQVKLQGKIK